MNCNLYQIKTIIHNLIVGKLWIENTGDTEIIGISGPCTGHICRLSFDAYSYFSRTIPRRVQGIVSDSLGNSKWIMNGVWDSHLEVSPIISSTRTSRLGMVGSIDHMAHTVEPFQTIWTRNPSLKEYEEFAFFTFSLICL